MSVLRILSVIPSELYASSSAASMTAKTAWLSSCGDDRFCSMHSFKGVSLTYVGKSNSNTCKIVHVVFYYLAILVAVTGVALCSLAILYTSLN